MSRRRIALMGASIAALVVTVTGTLTGTYAQSQTAARGDGADAAVNALVGEVRALRADMAAAARNQLRAQLLLGRVQMQEQRLAYLDKQRTDTAAQIAMQSQLTSAVRNQTQGFDGDGCSRVPADQRRDCEANAARIKRQLAEQEQREAQLRAQENEVASALSAEQARWSDFNARLDELERTLR